MIEAFFFWQVLACGNDFKALMMGAIFMKFGRAPTMRSIEGIYWEKLKLGKQPY